MRCSILYAFLGCLGLSNGVVAAGATDAYGLNPGDTLLISVWREEGMQKEVKVLPDGSITFPLAGRVEVAGVDVAQVATRVEQKLKAFIPEPIVTVVISAAEGNRAYVLGKVLKPGAIIMTGPTTVLQAISMSGGLDRFAKEGSIKVLRNPKDAKPQTFTVDYGDLIAGRDLGTNILLKAGDTILVP